jgi:hypothetical protein
MTRRTIPTVLLSAFQLIAAGGAGLRWTIPENWAPQSERPMRLATYTVPASKGDREPAEFAVFYFGQGQGGTVDANLDRWIGQFTQADGKPSKNAAKIDHNQIHGLKVATVDVSGTYNGMGGPMQPVGKPAPGYRLLGAIIEGPQGLVFFKFTGPVKTITDNENQYHKILASVTTG